MYCDKDGKEWFVQDDYYVDQNDNSKLCKCGCGEEIGFKESHRWDGVPDYIHGHGTKGRDYEDIHGVEEEKKLWPGVDPETFSEED